METTSDCKELMEQFEAHFKAIKVAYDSYEKGIISEYEFRRSVATEAINIIEKIHQE